MSEPQSNTRVVRITEAAKLLKVSVRTIQRRLDAGELEAVFEDGTRHVRLPAASRVSRDSERDMTRQSDAPQRDNWHDSGHDSDSDTANSRADAHDNGRQAGTSEHATAATPGTPERYNVARQKDAQRDIMAELLAEKDARIVDLRAQVEAANRQAAEATAALREYLKMQAKALTAPADETTSSSTRNVAEVSREDGAEATKSEPTGKEPRAIENGSRGQGLRDLRAIFRALLGLR